MFYLTKINNAYGKLLWRNLNIFLIEPKRRNICQQQHRIFENINIQYVRLCHTVVPSGQVKKISNPFSKEESEEFMSLFPEFVNVLTKVEPWNRVPSFTEKLKEVLLYNVGNRTLTRGIATVYAYRSLQKSRNISSENLNLVIMLGWCINMLESSVFVIDDIIDNSTTRCGVPCWFRKKNVGLHAIIDGVYLDQGVYYVLKKYLSSHQHYHKLIELFWESSFKATLGQSLDLMPVDFKNFNMEYYNILTIGKAQYFLFYGSIIGAMYMANIVEEDILQQVKPVLLSLGYYYQIQNDFLDCYGNPLVTGKAGADDIREGKCSWLAVKALQKCSLSQRKLMEENYGRNHPKSIEAIRNIYDELNMPEEYKKCETQMYNSIYSNILNLGLKVNKELFFNLLDKLYNREWVA